MVSIGNPRFKTSQTDILWDATSNIVALSISGNGSYGHTHDIQRMTGTKFNGTIGSWSFGCLKDMSREQNKWLRGRLHNWAHAFGIIDWFPTGDFRMDVVDIHKGKTFVWGQTIDGNKYELL